MITPSDRTSFLEQYKTQKIPQLIQQTQEQTSSFPQVGFWGGAKHGWLPTYLKLAGNKESWFGGEYTPTDQQRFEALRTLNFDNDRYQSLIQYSDSKQAFAKNLQIIKDVQDYRIKQGQVGLARSLLSGIGGGVTDPTSYIPFGGQIGWGGRIAVGALTSAASSVMNQYVMGDDDDPLTSMAFGAAFGGTVQALKGSKNVVGTHFGDTSRRSISKLQKIASDTSMTVSDTFKAKGVMGALNQLRDKVENSTYSLTVGGAFRKVEKGSNLDKLIKNFIGSERGFKTSGDDNTVLYKNFQNDGNFTANEYFRHQFDKGMSKIQKYDELRDHITKTTKLSPTQIDHYIRRSVDGAETPLDNIPQFNQLVKTKKDYYQERMQTLKSRGLIDGQVSSPTGGQYEPHRLNTVKVNNQLQNIMDNQGVNLNTAKRILQKRIATLLVRSIQSPQYDRAIRKYFQKRVVEPLRKEAQKLEKPFEEPNFQEWLVKKANQDALGYVDMNKARQNNLLEDRLGLKYTYQNQRVPWKYTDQEDSGFSIDSLLSDSGDVIRSYNHRTSADIGANLAYGVTNPQQLKNVFNDAINQYASKYNQNDPSDSLKKELSLAVKSMMDAYYGRLGSDAIDGGSWGNAMADSLTHLTYATHNSYMGYLNHFQIAAGIQAYGGMFFLKSIPKVGQMFKDWSTGVISKQQKHMIINQLFGHQLIKRGNWNQILDRNISRYQGNLSKAHLVSGTQWLATNSPFSRYVQASNNSIVSQAHWQFLGDLIRYSHGDRSGAFLDTKTLKRLQIPQNRFNKLLDKLKGSTSLSADKINIKSLEFVRDIQEDLQSIMTLKRLANYVADQVIQRNSLQDTFIWRGSNKNTMMRLLTQFKTFALRSYNKRFVKMLNRLEQGEYAKQFHLLGLSTALGSIGFMGQMAMMTSGMSEQQRKAYYKNVLGTSNPDFTDPQVLLNLGISGVMRSSILAYPALLLNTMGFKAGVKTSVGQGVYTKDQANQLNWNGFVRDYIPALNTLTSIYGLRADSVNLINSNYLSPQEFRNSDRKRYARNFGRNLKAVTPNVPFMQQQLINYITQDN